MGAALAAKHRFPPPGSTRFVRPVPTSGRDCRWCAINAEGGRNMARIFGYARSADYDRAPSLERQLVEWKARKIRGTWKGCRAEHGAGLWADRPEFRALLEELEPGDGVVV